MINYKRCFVIISQSPIVRIRSVTKSTTGDSTCDFDVDAALISAMLLSSQNSPHHGHKIAAAITHRAFSWPTGRVELICLVSADNGQRLS